MAKFQKIEREKMIRLWKNFLGNILFWSDILFIGIHAFIGVALIYTGFYAWGLASSYYEFLNFPMENYKDTTTMFAWVYSLKDIEKLKFVGYAWIAICATGFSFTLALLAIHEALIRLRIRLG